MSTTEIQRSIAGLQVVKVSESAPHLKMLIYGLPGAGKTRLSGSAAEVEEMKPLLYIDVEGGTKTIRDLWPDIEVVRVKPIYDKGGRAIKTAWTQLREIYEALKKGDGDYRTAVVDNVTEAYQLSMQDVMTKLVSENPERDFDVPGMREWGKASAQVRRWVRNMRDLDMNIIMTAHEAPQKDDSEIVRGYTPSLPGKLANEIPGFFDEVFYLYTKQERDAETKTTKVVRKLQTQPAGKYVAKDRSDKLPIVLSDPTMAKIYREVV